MSNDPLAVLEIGTGPSDQADYDTVHAAFLGTERGRWFLTEYQSRNRAPRPPTSADALPQAHTSRRRDLVELATAIDRIKTEIAASDAQQSNGLAAAERLQDIAFALRERDVDAALCDALDKAIREISLACALNDATAERTRKAAHLVRDLAGRITDTIGLWIARDRGESLAAEIAMTGSVAAGPEVAIADAAALPTLAEPPGPKSDQHNASADAILAPGHSEDETATPFAGAASDAVAEDIVANDIVAEDIVAEDIVAEDMSQVAASSVVTSEEPEALEAAPAGPSIEPSQSEPLTIAPSPIEPEQIVALADAQVDDACSEVTGIEQVDAEPPALIGDTGEALPAPVDEAAPAGSLPPEATAPGPDDDPADLFEPLPTPNPFAATAKEEIAVIAPEVPASPEPAAASSNVASVHGQHAADDARLLALAEPTVLRVPAAASAEQPEPPAVGVAETAQDSGNSSAPPNNEADRAPGPGAAATEPSVSTPADVKPAAEAAPPHRPVAAAPGARPLPRSMPNDPLAALRALSEEEIMALFS